MQINGRKARRKLKNKKMDTQEKRRKRRKKTNIKRGSRKNEVKNLNHAQVQLVKFAEKMLDFFFIVGYVLLFQSNRASTLSSEQNQVQVGGKRIPSPVPIELVV